MTPRKPTRAKQLGIDDAVYFLLLEQQGGHCALCPNTPKTEHDRNRAWRCRYCTRRNSAASAVCEACAHVRPKPARFHADHDHKTGRVRGLLCWKCNDALPTWVTAEWLRRAADYISPSIYPSCRGCRDSRLLHTCGGAA